MIHATVAGNIGKDAVLRDAGTDRVLGFSVASSRKMKDKETTLWVDCSIWGKRGEALAKHLTKGKKVVCVGELGTREYEGKTYLTLRVAEIEFMGGGQQTQPAANGQPAPARETEYDAGQGEDNIPF